MIRHLRVIALFGMVALASRTWAQVAPAGREMEPPIRIGGATSGPATAPAEPGELLGARFESEASAIAFRPPARCQLIRRKGVAEEVAQYRDEQRQWTLLVRRISLAKPQPLVITPDPAKPGDEGRASVGMLAATVTQVTTQLPGAQLIRNEIIRIRDHEKGPNDKGIPVGMLAYRYADGQQRWFRQQALVEAEDQLYYAFDLTVPTTKLPDAPEDQVDAGELAAAETFGLVVRSVELLDRAAILHDQEQRLLRTRVLLVNFAPDRIKSKLIPEACYRLLRRDKDGAWNDIGYSYVVEEPTHRAGNDGISIAVRSFTRPEPNYAVDVVSEAFCSLDMKHEVWASLMLGNDEKTNPTGEEAKKSFSREVGVSDQSITGRRFTLRVEQRTRAVDKPPVERDLPPYYMSQAIGQLLPRLMPNDGRTYLFSTWVATEREVMMRYIDVEHARDENLGGQRVTVVPIKDRIGFDGAPTYHFVDLDGKYLGSRNEESGIMILASDPATIKKRWPQARLERPFVLDKPQGN